MGNTTFELRAHNFASAHSDMVIKHLFTFSISVRLPWAGRRWNAYYKWLEYATPSAEASLGDFAPITVIATGFGLSPTYYNSSESMPKDVIGYEAKATRLHYVRKKGRSCNHQTRRPWEEISNPAIQNARNNSSRCSGGIRNGGSGGFSGPE